MLLGKCLNIKIYSGSLMLFRKLCRVKTQHWKIRRRISTDNSRTNWKSCIGLEIHAQLSTRTKLFSSAPYYYGAPTNSVVTLFDAAIPGTLPVLNKTAVELAVISALALGCDVNPVSYFDRKHYFYPDLPAGYQITQQRQPLARNGLVEYAIYQPGVHSKPYYKQSRIKQIQLEQDSGKSLHEHSEKQSYIDLNRAGVALIEIVFEPDVEDEQEACSLVKEVITILERADACSGKLEEGALRIDVNVSVCEEGDSEMGVRTEIKNIGSVHGVVNAIKYETQRQLNIVRNGGTVTNETLMWDSVQCKTIPMRDKEDSHDYRFVPEPNLPPLRLLIDEDSESFHGHVRSKNSIVDVRHLKDVIPVSPQMDRMYLIEKHGLNDVQAYNLVNQDILFKYFKQLLMENPLRDPKTTYLVLMNQLLAALNSKSMSLEQCKVSASHLGQIVDLIQNRRISKMTSDALILELVNDTNDLSPVEFVAKNNLEMISNPKELRKYCLKVVNKEVAVLMGRRSKRKAIFNELVKKVIEETKFRADTRILPSIMSDVLSDLEKDK